MNSTASATVNGVAATFVPATRPLSMSTTPVVASVNVTIPLDRADLVALLFFYCQQDPAFRNEASDADAVRQVIADTAVNFGLCQVETTVYEIEDLAADDARQELVEFCRHRVAELFPDVPEQTRRPRGAATAAHPSGNAETPLATPQGRELVNA